MLSLSRENIFIAAGALILTTALLLPRQVSTCPKGRTYDPVLGGSCPLFVDENLDGICDIVQGAYLEHDVTASRRPGDGFNLSFGLEFFAFFSLFIIAAILSLVKPKPKFPTDSSTAPIPKPSRLGFLNLEGFPWRRFPSKSVNLRYLTLIAGLLLGIWTWKRFCPLGTLQLLLLQRDKIVLLLFPFLVFLIPIIAALIIGRIFCFWICPIGALQELIWKASQRISQRSNLLRGWTSQSQKIPRYFDTLKYVILIVVAAGTVYFGETISCKICPFGFFFSCSKISIALGILIFASLFSIFAFLYRPFCRFFCPYGAILKFLSKFSLRHQSRQR